MVGARSSLARAEGRGTGGLDAAMMAAAAKMRMSAMRSSRARSRARKNSTDATARAIQANPPNPASKPPINTRYVAVMSGSPAPVACRRMLDPQPTPRGIIQGTVQSNRVAFSLHGEWQRHSLSYSFSDEG